jgi:membrane associated rhomboid family serine protease
LLSIGDDESSIRIDQYITYILITLNVIFFFIEINGGEAFITTWAFIPSRFIEDPLGSWVTVFTSMFMHAGWVHLGENMLYLGIFSNNMEDRFQHIRFLLFYLFCGLGVMFRQLYFSLESSVPNLGASGAIAGVLGAYMLMFPGRRVNVLFSRGIFPVPAVVVIGFWFVLQLFSGASSITSISDTGCVAYMAYIGGFITGFILAIIFR